MESRSAGAALQIGLLQKYGRENFAQRDVWGSAMDTLNLFGLSAVTAMLVAYALEDRSHWFILAFAGACALGSVYGFLQGAWPFGLVEAIWAGVALRRWYVRRQ
jgi:hypothetical protein